MHGIKMIKENIELLTVINSIRIFVPHYEFNIIENNEFVSMILRLEGLQFIMLNDIVKRSDKLRPRLKYLIEYFNNNNPYKLKIKYWKLHGTEEDIIAFHLRVK